MPARGTVPGLSERAGHSGALPSKGSLRGGWGLGPECITALSYRGGGVGQRNGRVEDGQQLRARPTQRSEGDGEFWKHRQSGVFARRCGGTNVDV